MIAAPSTANGHVLMYLYISRTALPGKVRENNYREIVIIGHVLAGVLMAPAHERPYVVIPVVCIEGSYKV